MKEILTICCSRNRPKESKDMYASFMDTSNKSDIVFLLDSDDNYQEYYKFLPYNNTIIGKQSTVTERINEAVSNFKDFKYYHLTNDDVIYQTPQWDEKFMQVLKDYGHGIVYGNDLFQKQNLPTFPFISSEIVHTLGWLQMPLLNKLYGDNVWQIIGQNTSCLYYCPDVIIEHKTFFAEKSIKPNKEEWDSYMKIYESDKLMFIKWLQNCSLDIEKVKQVCQTRKLS